MIELKYLTKEYGDKRVVDQLNLTLQRGVITGFLGPNGAGKSTTMKMMISLVHPTTGRVLIEGEEYQNLKEPLKKIGALIDPSALDENLTARQHLDFIATAAGIDLSRVDEMISMAGLEEVKNKKIKSFSLGMKQRLGIGTALISDPDTIILDEPFNGLDVDGIRWLRKIFRDFADQGKAVIVSSHLMSEIQAIADRIVIIGQGKLLADMTIDEMHAKSLSSYVYVEANDLNKLRKSLEHNHAIVQIDKNGLQIRVLKAKEIGEIAYKENVILYALTEVNPSLEDIFTEITEGTEEYISTGGQTNDAFD